MTNKFLTFETKKMLGCDNKLPVKYTSIHKLVIVHKYAAEPCGK